MKRALTFTSLEDILDELEALERSETRTVGIWSYYQILTHLAESLEYSMGGYPSVLPSAVRKTVGRYYFRKMKERGHMEAGKPNPAAPKKRVEGDEKEALQRLLGAMERFRTYDGDFAVHPLFDKLTKPDWELLHSMHAANHLGFVHTVTEKPAKSVHESKNAPPSRERIAKKAVKKANKPAPAAKKATKPKGSAKKTARPTKKK